MVSEWVAFADDGGNDGFEAVVRKKHDSSHGRAKKSGRGPESARRRPADSSSVSSWMKQPINTNASWAPVAPPKATAPKSEHPVANKRRPPRTRSTVDSVRHQSNPVSSSDSSSSSVDGPSRGRAGERPAASVLPRSSSKTRDSALVSKAPNDSRRGRSKSRARSDKPEGGIVQMGSAPSRGRSSSRTRTNPIQRERSTSTTRRTSTAVPATKSSSIRSNSRPPPTSTTRRARSDSRAPITRSRSTSRTRPTAPVGNKPPPSTTRTRREMRVTVATSSSVGPGVTGGRRGGVSSRSVASEDGHASLRSAPDDNIGRDISFGQINSGSLSGGNNRQRSGLMEKLFGDQVTEEAKQSYRPSPKTSSSITSETRKRPEQIHPRILLTATVYHNTATNLWIATINTNQKGVAKNPATASKYLKAFSFSSEKEARESAIANAPPKMLSFAEHPNCFICSGRFAMFRRASHCRNCGVCVCNSCSTMWPARMIPETYNLKRESQVKVCNSCNHLSASFKKALLDGSYEEAIAVYGSGNIDLRTPFPQVSKKKEETMYPIHCAVAGGNLEIVRWLIEDHFCPIKLIRTGSSSKRVKRGGTADQLILTSRNRSVLTIAMIGLHVDILRYLVVDNRVPIYESKDLQSSLRALEAVLLALPGSKGQRRIDATVPLWDDRSFDGQSFTSSLDADQTLGEETFASSKNKTSSDYCIICYENSINCVMTPCGHQVCCLECSSNLSVCPVCNVRGEFIKIFRP